MAPKRRGRPPKQPAAQADDGESAEASPLKADSTKPSKRRGRPPATDDSDDDSTRVVPSEPVKRRGRPPKAKPAPATGEESSVDSRPSKETSSKPPPKRRGRPPKQATAAHESDVDAAEESSPKKPAKRRGRPPQKPAEPADEVDSMDTGASVKASPPSSPRLSADGDMNATTDAEKHLVAAMKPLSLKRKADDQQRIDLTPLKRARAGRVFVFGTGECAQLGNAWHSQTPISDGIETSSVQA